jgi:ankyrin repeat protein
LEEIDEKNWDYAHRLLQCVAAASRPLRAEELAEFLAFDFDAGFTPKFLADWRSEDAENEVLSICSTLLVIVKPRLDSPVIQFAHFSVKEYLTSARLAKAKDTISRFHVSMTPAHTIVAQACLGALLHLDENITKDRLKGFPLAEYAAEHWADHARIESVSSKVEDGMKRLFDPSKSHLSVWLWIFDPELLSWSRSERLSQARATQLHYAAVCNIHDIATFLIVEHSQDVNAWGFDREETPLHVSSRLGHVEITRVLLKHGADIEARDKRDWSPLDRATTKGHVELTRVLLEHGANVNARDKRRRTPLYLASDWGKPAVVQVLLRHGADVNARDKDNEAPLQRAKVKEVAQILLEHGADANSLETRNRTQLHLASENGRVALVQVLLEHGVDANARDANDVTPLHLASDPKPNSIVGRYLHIIRLLLQYGSDIHARDYEGRTPFMRAGTKRCHKIMQLLLEHGAKDHRA